jgi:hypothetical protein
MRSLFYNTHENVEDVSSGICHSKVIEIKIKQLKLLAYQSAKIACLSIVVHPETFF